MDRYSSTGIIVIENKQAYETTKYPAIPISSDDLYLYTTVGDRYDTLAFQIYNDKTLWWIIAAANPELAYDSIVPPIGAQVRVPSDPQQVIRELKVTNI